MIDERAQQRARAIPAISRACRTPEFRTDHPREMTIIPVLPGDTISYLLARLDEAESPAALAMLTDDGLRMVSLMAEHNQLRTLC